MEDMNLTDLSLELQKDINADDNDTKLEKKPKPPKPPRGKIIEFRPCEYSTFAEVFNGELDNQGRILDLDIRLKDVCPNKHVALGVEVTELDDVYPGVEHPRGFRTMLVKNNDNHTKDMLIQIPKFILPEELALPSQPPHSRTFKVRAYAHYINVYPSPTRPPRKD